VFRSGLILLSLVLTLAAAGCGGGGGGGGSGSGTQTSGNKTAGETLLADAGLQTCTHHQSTGAAWYGTGFVQGVSSEVAPDCNNAPAVPTTVYGLTYKDNDTADTAAAAIRKSHPKDQVIQPTVAPYTTTVIVVEGPKSEEYAKSIRAALPKG
jgi:hypothetical protein